MFMLQKYHWFSTITMVVIKHYVIIDMVGLLSIIAVNITIRHYWYIKTIVFITLLTDHSIHLFFWQDKWKSEDNGVIWNEVNPTKEQTNNKKFVHMFKAKLVKSRWTMASRIQKRLQLSAAVIAFVLAREAVCFSVGGKSDLPEWDFPWAIWCGI